jgi:hypothetical protein
MAKKLMWVDLEMSGLDWNLDKILEVAIVVTDLNFQILDEYHRVVFQPQIILDTMNDWCKEHHGKSGLSAEVPHGTPLEQVEAERDRLKNAIQEIVALCPDADPYDSAGPTSRGYYLALRDIKHRLVLELNTVTTIEEDEEEDRNS